MKQGFTLLELSIVLVIIGLIIGGITVGADLIKAAQLNSVASEVNKFKVAINSFKLKYNALPGDMKNATAYWGDQATGTSACADSAVTDGTPGTCNGDGDAQWDSAERLRMWQHLSLSDIIPDNYTGVAGASTTYDIGVNLPASAYDPAGYFPAYNSNYEGTSVSGNRIGLGNAHASGGGNSNWNGVLQPAEAQQLDEKIDDGLADQGKVITINGSSYLPQYTSGDCITGVSGDFTYALSSTLPACHVSFFID